MEFRQIDNRLYVAKLQTEFAARALDVGQWRAQVVSYGMGKRSELFIRRL